MTRPCWNLLAHAVELRERGATTFSPGVSVALVAGPDGVERCVASAYGGYRPRVEVDVVVEAARLALEEWPGEIHDLRVVVEPDPPRNGYTRRARRARGLA